MVRKKASPVPCTCSLLGSPKLEKHEVFLIVMGPSEVMVSFLIGRGHCSYVSGCEGLYTGRMKDTGA